MALPIGRETVGFSVISRGLPIVLNNVDAPGSSGSLISTSGAPIRVFNSNLERLSTLSIGGSASQTPSETEPTSISAQPKPIVSPSAIADKSPEVISSEVARTSVALDRIAPEQIASLNTPAVPTPLSTRQMQALPQQSAQESSASIQTSSAGSSMLSQPTSSSESSSSLSSLTGQFQIVGKVIHCMNCPFMNNKPFKQSEFIGRFSLSTSQSITEDGEYTIVHLGEGRLHVIRVADHVHTEAGKKSLFNRLLPKRPTYLTLYCD